MYIYIYIYTYIYIYVYVYVYIYIFIYFYIYIYIYIYITADMQEASHVLPTPTYGGAPFVSLCFTCGGAEAMKTQNSPPGAHSVTKKERVASPLRPSATL